MEYYIDSKFLYDYEELSHLLPRALFASSIFDIVR